VRTAIVQQFFLRPKKPLLAAKILLLFTMATGRAARRSPAGAAEEGRGGRDRLHRKRPEERHGVQSAHCAREGAELIGSRRAQLDSPRIVQELCMVVW
jgi:hypothetical protein